MMRSNWFAYPYQLVRYCRPVGTLLHTRWYASSLLPFFEEILAFPLRYMPVFYGVVWAVVVACKAGQA